MGRPRTINDQEIIAAARDVFLEQGFSATTSEVARRVGVSEGSIFNRFGSKRQLFQCAMQMSIEQEPWLLSLPERVGQGDVRAHLVAVAIEGIGFFEKMMPLMMMGWSNPGVQVTHSSMPTGPLLAIDALAAYLDAEMALGRVRRVSPTILARALLSGMTNYAFLEILRRQHGGAPLLSVETYVHGLVDVLWSGVSANDEEDG